MGTTPAPGVRTLALSSEKIRALAEPVATDLGLEVWDVEVRGVAPRCVLRVFLDRPGGQPGVSVADCESVSRRLGDVLDAYDAVDGHYLLEVSSPGINRSLTRPEHFQRVVGSRIRVRQREPVSGSGVFVGTLDRFEDGMLYIVGDDGATRRLLLESVASARTEFDFGGGGRGRGKGKRG